jgi:hypothetical protein
MNPARTDTAGRFGFFASQIWGFFFESLFNRHRLAEAAEPCQNGLAVKKSFHPATTIGKIEAFPH